MRMGRLITQQGFLIVTLLLIGCAGTGLHEHNKFEGLRYTPSVSITQTIPTARQIGKSMRAQIKAQPRCFICNVRSNIVNGNKNDVHHVLLRSKRPDLAADPDNLVTLCRACHFTYGHGQYWRAGNTNFYKAAEAAREVIKKEVKRSL